ncbi:hypothetical protein FisN_12Lh276 [Fistulifera solaris]|jgi:hypothetical protein|uniref:MPN domain-containing protein n=1 Tax=Fistulifera solaris TaxID=1519565 RepID=A0A1Z5JML5_FISSO|nr:hypothetical protein FisN_12Lh276 [Fistulifera solaris]|eukprot:GAX15028.1 hypothetical protein FisN_12Lh276 [Fistulifera solaris]
MTKQSVQAVSVEPSALLCITQHAAAHPYEAIHGVLIGPRAGIVQAAIPVCHGTPTRPLVETALGLIQTNIGQKTIVGWYTAPALLQDTKAGPVALRMVANLETDDVEPVLLVLQNEKLAACRKGEGTAENLLKAFGKDDLGGQWVRPLECTIKDASSAIEQMKTGTSSSPTIHDFVDHLEGSASTPWVTL